MANDDSKNNRDKDSLFTDALKKVFTAGITGALLTEEGIRSYLSEIKLPKEVLNVILQGAAKQKDELQFRLAKEISGVIQKIDWVKEVSKLAETHKFKISAEIELIKKDKRAPEDF